MQSEVWSRVLGIWDEAKLVPEEELDGFLERVFGSDTAARREAASLLSRHAVEDTFLETPAIAEAEADGLHPALRPDWIGRRVGAYELEEHIGAGGMGVVYRARRADAELDYQVAVKLIHLALVGTDVEARFRTERQILAGLDQPNIARLLDGGATEGGIPYVVMELVSGMPITEYCDRLRAPLDARLVLFRKVCEAVHYAHRHLVVHRDLKPGNILVNEDGEPKLLDFGIAKLLVPSQLDDQPTATLARAFTPNYASPEQLLGGQITTASDIYSLGVVLYELLTGQRPYDWTEKTPLEVARTLELESAPLPSERARANGSPLGLDEDLDRVVTKALRREPELRYPSAEQLSEDLRRYLAGLPVVARPSTLRYRAGKFVRRNRSSVSLAAALALSTVTFAAFSAVQARRLADQRDVAETQRESAEEVTEFLEGVFKIVNPGQGTGDTIRARELIDRQAERVRSELADQPELQARLLHSLGGIYNNLGLYQEVEPLLEQSLELRRETLGDDHLETAETQRELASLLTEVSEYERAQAHLEQALASERSSLPEDDLRIALTLDRMGTNLKEMGEHARAEEAFRESLRIRRQRGDDELVSDSLHSLADVLRIVGDLEQAVPLAREALRISQQISKTSVESGERLYLMGHLDFLQGRYEQAENRFIEGSEIFEEIFGREHPATTGMLGNVAAVRLERGDYAAAVETYRETLEIYRAHYGDRSSRAATIQDQIGIALMSSWDLEAASQHLGDALAIRQELFGEEHPALIKSLRHVAAVARKRGKSQQAEVMARQALAIAGALHLGEEHNDVAVTLTTLGQALGDQGKLGESEEVLRRAIAAAMAVGGEAHLATVYARRALAKVLWKKGELEAAEKLYLAVTHLLREKDTNHLNLGMILLELADLKISRGDTDTEASSLLEEARRLLQARSLPLHPGLVIARSVEGALRAARGPSDEAQALLVKSHQQLALAVGQTSPVAQAALIRLTRAYEHWGWPEPAS